ncbi:M56 family metallopeptidase [Kibdelosporangium philippinense]|uniref:M56 family metallopeptidase n=1 Tax=Kibdelosporangium philippinense TaxID=211113 RepID=A0ABS8Z956_9PSEU|nr:M56 family metallopeptidase [Kibdelosporangium philippinense]MCE7003624.1 M56 family metallopeptidase [Kibdelosporangium philippinense]
MFDHFVVSVVAVPLVVWFAMWLLADRLRPDLAARAFAWAAIVAAASSVLNLLSFALKALAEIPAVADLGGWSYQVVLADTAHVSWVSWFSFAWTVFIVVAVIWQVWRHSRAMHSAHTQAGMLESEGEVVIIPDRRVDAFALPGAPGRIVVTRGMRDTLDEAQYAAVVAHERAHLVHNHQRLVWLARLAAVIHPALIPVVRKVEFLVERAADEQAAIELGDRGCVARAIGLAALAASARPAVTSRVGPLMMAVSAAPGVVPGRVKALLGPGQVRRWQVVVPAALALGTLVWTAECIYDLFELLALASR